MPDLLKTTKDAGHYHLVYVRRLEEGYTSVEKPRKHRHDVVFRYKMDPMTGRELVDPKTGGTVPEEIVLAEAEGHTHRLEEIVDSNSVPRGKEEEKVAEVLRLWKTAKEFDGDAFEKAEECERFYASDQWEKGTKDKLKAEQRAALTINEIEAKLDILGGYQRRNRTQFQFLPVEGGDEIGANLATLVVKNVCNQNEFEHEENEFFDDLMIAGRGAWDVDIDYNENIEGDIVIKHRPWKKLRLGPHDDARLSDLEYLCNHDMYSEAKVKQMWPDKKSEVGLMFAAAGEDEQDDTPRSPGRQYDTEPLKDFGSMLESPDMIDLERKNIRVIECWRKMYRRVFTIVAEDDDFVFEEPIADKAMANKAKTIKGLQAVERNPFYMRVTTIAGAVLLSDDIPDLAVQDFQTVVAYAKKRGRDFWGKIRPALDPQREMNKRISQSIDILNRCVVYAIYYDDKTFDRANDVKTFKENATKPGALIRVADTTRPPKREEGVKFPNEVAQMIVISRETLREILSIGPAMQGLEQGQQSGIALVEKKKQGVIGNEFLFDNKSMAKRKLGKMLLSLIQAHYSPQRIARIVMSQAARDASSDRGEMPTLPTQGADGQQEQRDLTEFTMDEIVAFLETRDLTKYDVVAAEREWTPTIRRATFYEMAQMMQHGAPIPAELVLDLSDLPKKEKQKAIAMVQQAQAREQQMEDAKIKSETDKAMIAAESRMQSSGREPA